MLRPQDLVCQYHLTVRGLNVFLEKLGVPRALRDFGLRESGLDAAAEKAMNAQDPNPRRLEEEALRELLQRAWAGEPARVGM